MVCACRSPVGFDFAGDNSDLGFVLERAGPNTTTTNTATNTAAAITILPDPSHTKPSLRTPRRQGAGEGMGTVRIKDNDKLREDRMYNLTSNYQDQDQRASLDNSPSPTPRTKVSPTPLLVQAPTPVGPGSALPAFKLSRTTIHTHTPISGPGHSTSQDSLALLIGCLGTVAPLIHLAKAAPTPPHGLVAFSAVVALGGFLKLGFSGHAAVLALEHLLAYTDITMCMGVCVAYAVNSASALSLSFVAVYFSVWLGGCLVYRKHGLRTQGQKNVGFGDSDMVKILELGNGSVSVDGINDTVMVTELTLTNTDKCVTQPNAIKDIFEHATLGGDSDFSSTPHKPRLNPFAPEFMPVGRRRVPLTVPAFGNPASDLAVCLVPIVPPRRRVCTRLGSGSFGIGEE